jgi:hypothetical protein
MNTVYDSILLEAHGREKVTQLFPLTHPQTFPTDINRKCERNTVIKAPIRHDIPHKVDHPKPF